MFVSLVDDDDVVTEVVGTVFGTVTESARTLQNFSGILKLYITIPIAPFCPGISVLSSWNLQLSFGV